jgi:hypothetical protein
MKANITLRAVSENAWIEIMLMLYSNACIKNTLRLNVGRGQLETQRLNLIDLQINSVASSIMSAVSRDKLCYCCAYMKKVHSVLCARKITMAVSFEAQLLTNFIDE